MEQDKKTRSQIICEAISGILMICAIIAYLIVGFVAKIWHPTWLILVVSGLLCGIINLICNTTNQLKKLSDNEDNKKE